MCVHVPGQYEREQLVNGVREVGGHWREVLELGELKGGYLELRELKGWGERNLDRVLEREKHVACSVRRKKRERSLPVPVHG